MSDTGFERTAATTRFGVRGACDWPGVWALLGAPSDARGDGGDAHPASKPMITTNPEMVRRITTLSPLLSQPTIVKVQPGRQMAAIVTSCGVRSDEEGLHGQA